MYKLDYKLDPEVSAQAYAFRVGAEILADMTERNRKLQVPWPKISEHRQQTWKSGVLTARRLVDSSEGKLIPKYKVRLTEGGGAGRRGKREFWSYGIRLKPLPANLKDEH